MAWGENVSVKYEEQDRPTAVLEGDSRLDGRGYEMFRSVCELGFMKLIRPAIAHSTIWLNLSHHCNKTHPR